MLASSKHTGELAYSWKVINEAALLVVTCHHHWATPKSSFLLQLSAMYIGHAHIQNNYKHTGEVIQLDYVGPYSWKVINEPALIVVT